MCVCVRARPHAHAHVCVCVIVCLSVFIFTVCVLGQLRSSSAAVAPGLYHHLVEPIQAYEGDTVVLACQPGNVGGHERGQVSFLHDHSSFPLPCYKPNTNFTNLQIQNITFNHSGLYQCRRGPCSNTGDTIASFRVTVLEAPGNSTGRRFDLGVKRIDRIFE